MPDVFLSSTFWEEEHPDNPLRRAFVEAAEGRCWDYNAVYGAQPHSFFSGEPHAFRDLLRCVDGVRSCKAVAVLVCNRHGSGIDVDPDRRGDAVSRASFFEAEIFAAAALGRPIVLFIDTGFEPGAELDGVLGTLLENASSVTQVRGSRRELVDQWKALLDGKMPLQPPDLGRMIHGWAIRRSHGDMAAEAVSPRLAFVNVSRIGDANAHPASAMAILRALDAPPPMVERELGHLGKLTLLWSAWRDIADGDAGVERFQRLAYEILGRWTLSASWLGLHAHIGLAPLAAAHSQRALAARTPDLWREFSLRHPDHARASALYSVARHSDQPRTQYLTVIGVVSSLAETPDAFEEARSVRAKASMQLAALNPRQDGWRLLQAFDDLQQALRYRQRAADRPFALGDAMVELGAYEARMSGALVGISRIKDGIAAMVEAAGPCPTAEEHGFLARALRTLGECAKGRRHASLREEAEVRLNQHVRRSDSFDQLRLL